MALTKITNSAIADDIGLGGNPTTSTQTAGNSTTRIATTAFVSTAVANLVDSAPATLNTLNELAAAIGDNATFSSTMTTSIASKLPLAGGTMTGNLNLGDNVRARFGTGNDLQLWHNGTFSILDGGDFLRLRATNDVKIQNYNSTASMAIFTPGGAVKLYYDNALKLATTTTGIDVTGTATVDGLTVEATSDALIRVSDSTNANQRLDLQHNSGVASLIAGNNGAYGTIKLQAYNGTDTVDRFKISANGDVDLGYEDTGTTAKLFWDASAESLGIGDAAPLAPLFVNGNETNTTDLTAVLWARSKTGAAVPQLNVQADQWQFGGGGTLDTSPTMTVDYGSNKVGIGTSSPSQPLHVSSANDILALFESTDFNSRIEIKDNGGSSFVENRGGILNLKADSVNAAANSRIEFSVDNSEKMRIDSAGTLFLGTTSPTVHSSATGIVFDNGSLLNGITRGANNALTLAQNLSVDSGNTWMYLATDEGSYYQQYGGNHYFGTTPSGTAGSDATVTNRLTVLNGGNVIVGSGGTTTYNAALQVAGDITTTVDGNAYQLYYTESRDFITNSGATAIIKMIDNDSTNGMIDFRSWTNSSLMRLMNSGQLMVGTTDTNPTNNSSNSTADRGIVFNGTQGWIGNATYNEPTAYFNRTGTDGSIIEFIKSGGVVGSIASQGGELTIGGNGDVGIKFHPGLDAIMPWSMSAANYRTDAINLGASISGTNYRFKDLHLSGTVYAVGSANSGSNSHLPAILASGNYGGGIATRDTKESGWYQLSNGAQWHFYHNRTVGSDTPASKIVLSFNSDGAATFASTLASKSHIVTGTDNTAFEVKTNHSGNPSAIRVAGSGSINGVNGSFQNFFVLNVMKDSGSQKSLYAAGDIKTDGNIVIGTSGKGINFGATSDATGMSSELLDDYEEGTWTPVIQGLGGNAATATTGNAHYTKIGRLVYLSAYMHTINLSTITSGSYIVLTGLPFTATNYADFSISYRSGGWTDSSTAIVGGYVQNGTSYLYFVRPDGVEPSQGGGYAMSKMMLNVCYQAS